MYNDVLDLRVKSQESRNIQHTLSSAKNSLSNKKLPFGQRMLKLGLKPITNQQLAQFFGIEQKVKLLNEQEQNKIKELLNSGWQQSDVTSDFYYKWSENRTIDESYSPVRYSWNLKKYNLDMYANEEIPAFVYEHLDMARELGFKEFHVVEPRIIEEKTPDPALIATTEYDQFMISFWE